MKHRDPLIVLAARRALILGAIAVGAAACSGDDSSPATTSERCAGITWRQSTPGSVICPGASGCSCAIPQVCCGPADPSNTAVGTCSELTACAQIAITCDGPEDCEGGKLCCASGLAFTCKTEQECMGVNVYVACRSDEDCKTHLGTHCTPGVSGSYLEGVMAVCH